MALVSMLKFERGTIYYVIKVTKVFARTLEDHWEEKLLQAEV